MVQHSFSAIFHNSKIINPDNFHTLLLIILQKSEKGSFLIVPAVTIFPIVISNFIIFKFCFQIF